MLTFFIWLVGVVATYTAFVQGYKWGVKDTEARWSAAVGEARDRGPS